MLIGVVQLILVLEMGNTVNAITEMILEQKLTELNTKISSQVRVIDNCIENINDPCKQDLDKEFNKLKLDLNLEV